MGIGIGIGISIGLLQSLGEIKPSLKNNIDYRLSIVDILLLVCGARAIAAWCAAN